MQHELYLRELSVAFLPSTSLGREQCVCIYSVKTKITPKKPTNKNPTNKQIILWENVHARVLQRVLYPIWNIHIYYQVAWRIATVLKHECFCSSTGLETAAFVGLDSQENL